MLEALRALSKMPPGKLWHFTESPTGGVFISVGNVVLSKYGAVKQLAKTSDAEDNVIKVRPLRL